MEKCPPLGIYDVDHCKFMMPRPPLWTINKSENSSHTHYFDKLLPKTNEGKILPIEQKKNCIEETGDYLESTSNNYVSLKKSFPFKDHEMARELKKQENLSLKLVSSYDKNFWEKFQTNIKAMKEHIKLLKSASTNLAYHDPNKLKQLLKNSKFQS